MTARSDEDAAMTESRVDALDAYAGAPERVSPAGEPDAARPKTDFEPAFWMTDPGVRRVAGAIFFAAVVLVAAVLSRRLL